MMNRHFYEMMNSNMEENSHSENYSNLDYDEDDYEYDENNDGKGGIL